MPAADLPLVNRADIKPILEEYLQVSITPIAANLKNSKIAGENCEGYNTWLPPNPDRFKVSKSVTGMAYAWGQFDTPEVYKKRSLAGDLIGNTCGPITYAGKNFNSPCPNNANCVVKYSTGIDCSGLVTRAWRLANEIPCDKRDKQCKEKPKQGTSTLPSISSKLKNRDELKYGDILLKPGHVMIVEYVRHNPAKGREYGIVESASSPGGVIRRPIYEVEAGRYFPYRYLNIHEPVAKPSPEYPPLKLGEAPPSEPTKEKIEVKPGQDSPIPKQEDPINPAPPSEPTEEKVEVKPGQDSPIPKQEDPINPAPPSEPTKEKVEVKPGQDSPIPKQEDPINPAPPSEPTKITQIDSSENNRNTPEIARPNPQQKMEIVLKNGRILIISVDIDTELLVRIISALER